MAEIKINNFEWRMFVKRFMN